MRGYKTVSFSVAIILIAVLFAGVVTVPAAARNDTMQFRFNAAHTGGYSSVAGNTQPNNHSKWNYTTADVVFSSPTVVNGVVDVGSWNGDVYAINATPARSSGASRPETRFTLPPPSSTEWSTWGAGTVTSTPSTPPPGPSCGASRPETRLPPPLPLSTTRCMWRR
jgi:hypothetical protein